MSQRILVLASDPAVGRQHAQTLGADGHEVRLCENLDSAVQAATAGGFDSVLVELPIAESGPGDSLGRLHAANPAIAVIVTSRNPDIAAAVEAMRSGPPTTCANRVRRRNCGRPSAVVSSPRRRSGPPRRRSRATPECTPSKGCSETAPRYAKCLP